jgi:hypothetical protein
MGYDIGLYLASIPLESAVPLFLAVGMLVSIIGSWVVNSIFTPFQLEANNGVGGAKFGFLGEVYAVTLGLALIGAFDHYTTSQTNAQKEAATLASLKGAALVYNLPEQEADQRAMRNAVTAYARAVVDREWGIMSYGISDTEVSIRLTEIRAAFLGVEPLTSGQQALQQNTVEWVRQLSEYRTLRLTTVSRSLVALVWIVVIVGTLTAIIFPWFFGTFNILAQGAMSALLVSFLMLHLLVILQLSYPFVGDSSISSAAFLDVMR